MTLRDTVQRWLRSICVCCSGSCLGTGEVVPRIPESEIKENNKNIIYYNGERGSSFCSDTSDTCSHGKGGKCFSEGSGGLDEILLFSGDEGGTESSQRYRGVGYSTAGASGVSGLDSSELSNIIFASRGEQNSQYYDYDEEDLVKEIDKLYRESLLIA